MKPYSLLTALLLVTALGCDSDPQPTPRDALNNGWSVRLDEPSDSSPELRFLQLDQGIEVKPGPNASLWNPELQANGDFRITLDVVHLDSGAHPHGAGLTLGGTDVDGAEQRYTYFLVRCDQKFLIKNRRGDLTDDIVSWTRHEALQPEDEQGVTTNRLSVEVRGDDVRFSINETEVHRAKRDALSTGGQVGLRLVHDIHVRFGVPLIEQL